VETSLDSPSFQSCCPYPTCRFLANFYDTSPDENHGEGCGPEFHLSSLQQPSASLIFDDKYAFRPTSSATAAIISILRKVTHLLVICHFIAIVFSKAFDTVRHSMLLAKLA